jgi:hypothetical protein
VNDRVQKANPIKSTRARHAKTPLRVDYNRNELASKANDRFLRSGAQIKDVYGKLGNK